MHAIVHPQAVPCSQIFADAGYELLNREPPVEVEEIQNEFVRKNIPHQFCCGSDEIIKLYVYLIESEPIVVHVDIDFAFYQPMDDLFDALGCLLQ